MQLVTSSGLKAHLPSWKTSRALMNWKESIRPAFIIEQQGWMTSICLQHSLLLDTYCSGKILFKILLFLDILSGHPRALMEMCNEIWVVLPVNRTFTLHRWIKKKFHQFKSFYLRNTFHKTIGLKIVSSSNGYGQNKLKKLSGKHSPF